MRRNMIFAGIAGVFTIIFLILGGLFLMASPVENTFPRLIIGTILTIVGLVLGVFTYLFATARTDEFSGKVTVDLPASSRLEPLICEHCNATLDPKSITMKEGVILVNCPYCDTIFELTEEPKW